MSIDLVFIVMLVGHVLADFYIQTEKLVERRKTSIGAVLLHGLIYSICIVIVFVICIPITANSIFLMCAVSLAHILIDVVKYCCIRKGIRSSWIKKHMFIVDQLAHYITLLLCWGIWGRQAEVRWFVSQEMVYLPYLPITIFLGVLCILKPVSIFITNTELWNHKTSINKDNVPSSDTKEAGKIIGYMERLIIFLLLMYNQFSAMAFVLTAKSVARFKEIEQDKNKAEYYLIGTLLSVVSAFAITVLLGLCKKGS